MFLFVAGIAGGAGTLISNIIQRLLRGRRSKRLFITSTAGVILGTLPVILFFLFTGSFFSILWQGIYLFIAVPAVYYGLSGVRL